MVQVARILTHFVTGPVISSSPDRPRGDPSPCVIQVTSPVLTPRSQWRRSALLRALGAASHSGGVKRCQPTRGGSRSVFCDLIMTPVNFNGVMIRSRKAKLDSSSCSCQWPTRWFTLEALWTCVRQRTLRRAIAGVKRCDVVLHQAKLRRK